MLLFKKVGIIGTGLIGGSLAWELKKRKLAKEIVGVSRHKQTIEWALRQGLINSGSTDLKIVSGADCVVLATPVRKISEIAKKISGLVDDRCLVTDVGSTKVEIVKELEPLFAGYIGSHPLAGSERRGVQNASLGLFQKTLCIITPTPKSRSWALTKLKRMWQQVGCRVVVFSSEQHDKIVSWVSHLPHALAFNLIASVPKKYLPFAASGFRDSSRIAGSDSRLWVDIFLSNSKNICMAIDSFQKRLKHLRFLIYKKDNQRLMYFLRQAQKQYFIYIRDK